MKKRFLCEKRGAEGGGYIFREENHLYIFRKSKCTCFFRHIKEEF